MSHIRLSTGSGVKELRALSIERDHKPSLLVSYPFLGRFNQLRQQLVYRDWVLDSGAFTAWRSGKPIDPVRYLDDVLQLLAEDSEPPIEVFALDVIGDPDATSANASLMLAAGISAIPTWHYREPFSVLTNLASTFRKIAIGGMAGTFSHITPTTKRKVVEQCFARVWPKLIHGFGVAGPDILERFPFDSNDASNWSTGPQKFGQWAAFGQWRSKVSVPSQSIDLRCEVEFYLALERQTEANFGHVLSKLRSNDDDHRATAKGSSNSLRRDGFKRAARRDETSKPKRRNKSSHD
jgi:hypothetical protein